MAETASAKQDDLIGKELARNLTLKEIDLCLKDFHTRYKCQSLPTPRKVIVEQNKTQKLEEERKLKVEPDESKSK